MRNFLRWWNTLDRPERIVAMSLVAGTVISIANSTTWAIAASYMTHQKTKVALAARSEASSAAVTSEAEPSMGSTPLPLNGLSATEAFNR
jgi:hypothetical protein